MLRCSPALCLCKVETASDKEFVVDDSVRLFAADYETQSDVEHSCRLDCESLSTEDYVDLLWTTVAEFPGKHDFILPSV